MRTHAMWRGVLVLASVALSLLLLEGTARLYGRIMHEERGMTFDPELGWRPLPHVRKVGSVWGVSRPASTNSQGWRDSEHTFHKPPGSRRAVAIGDSFTFGTDVDDGERFTDVLARRMNHLDVVNFGVPGYGTDQELRLLETQAFRYEPDVVILTVCLFNDLDDIGYERIYSFPKPYYSLEGGHLRLWKPELTWGMRVRTASYLVEFAYQRLMNEDNSPRLVPGFSSADAGQIFDALIHRMASVTAEHQARLVAVLAYGPDKFGDLTDVSRRVTASLDSASVPSLDTRKLFAARSSDPNRLLYSPIGGHWNAEGNAIVADGLRDLLMQVGVN